jgi:hypothetical protein
MPVLQSGLKNFGSRSRAVLKELSGRPLTVLWAAAALFATAGWLYFIAREASLIVSWLFGSSPIL